MPCSPVRVNWRFRGTSRLHLQCYCVLHAGSLLGFEDSRHSCRKGRGERTLQFLLTSAPPPSTAMTPQVAERVNNSRTTLLIREISTVHARKPKCPNGVLKIFWAALVYWLHNFLCYFQDIFVSAKSYLRWSDTILRGSLSEQYKGRFWVTSSIVQFLSLKQIMSQLVKKFSSFVESGLRAETSTRIRSVITRLPYRACTYLS
jgi:hypothetical protein